MQGEKEKETAQELTMYIASVNIRWSLKKVSVFEEGIFILHRINDVKSIELQRVYKFLIFINR